MDRISKPADCKELNRISSLVRGAKNAEPFATVRNHFRHEWQPGKAPVMIQRGQNFLEASNFHPFSNSKF
jgi:hypothetical protein